ncbi:hypothetical protein [Goodfellowiella coeruleoviolacea]|uniref:Uncharacterized protein n=1 Tax=Goodfellowiella coeruleoviolacea TaxID=334858 RepID=A0AAE3G9W9_9PSEU|nr:hypothetical protein [Goodfellowiella coeruleoviolacea]MCP2163560.1 hypothetical protein [Goodfellowiella coeruleoviolacea]
MITDVRLIIGLAWGVAMGLSVFVQNQIHDEVHQLHDDLDESFMRLCEAGPRASVRRGIVRHGDTVLNPFQLTILIEEITALPPDAVNGTITRILDAAEHAIRLRGYLFFSGD